jgi:hypothetical protein
MNKMLIQLADNENLKGERKSPPVMKTEHCNSRLQVRVRIVSSSQVDACRKVGFKGNESALRNEFQLNGTQII